ncbi:MAG: AAA family ATPase [Deltaproteobacteria bacterium]|nr:AAA family ATPase [Deltaproteobacteria bacterium]
MHLEDVTVEGFKSFSEKSEMTFQPGIGVIIGNNGVGKSNILDALLWGLGEDDLTRLRCLEDDELFFVGSKDKPPAEVARVALTFRQGPGKDAAAFPLIRERHKAGGEHFFLAGREAPREEYLAHLDYLELREVPKTVIKQEEINDLILLDPWQRLAAAARLLGREREETVELVRQRVAPLFEEYLHYLFPLGEGRLVAPEKDGQPGLDLEITLAGNRRRRAHQLSGGEKSVSSLALKLALFELLASPLYLLDEVEPALDYTNHKSMQKLLKTLAAKKQLIMITHLRSTIELANTLHGVRTRFDGSSFMKFYFVMDSRLLRLYKCC